MKKNLLALLLLFNLISYAQVATGPQTFSVCDEDNDGFYAFDLSAYSPLILGTQDPLNFTLSFFLTQMDADTDSSPLPLFFTNTSNPQTIIARVTDNNTGSYDTTEITLIVNPSPIITSVSDIEACDVDGDGYTTFDLSLRTDEIINGQTDVSLSFYETENNALSDTDALAPTYMNITPNIQTIYTRLEHQTTGCVALSSFNILTIDCTGQNVIVDESAFTVQELVEDVLLAGQCIQVSNITYSTGTQFGSGNPFGIGYFSTPGDSFPFSQGLVISNGSASDISGPNSLSGSVGSGSNTWPGDIDLQNIVPTQTYNATIIEFDFVPGTDQINFEFLMASEEYGQSLFECSFSDIFAFILTDSEDNIYNLAELPGSGNPISVSAIHPENDQCAAANEAYFAGYLPLNAPPIQLNGRTEVFTAQASVNAGETYHLKLVIADALDSLYDTAVFFNAGSFDIGAPCPDTDNDGIIDENEDVNDNGDLEDDDTDNDGTPNYLDDDDDGDNIDTIDEIQIENGRMVSLHAFIDTDDDTIENYLDDDDDGDGVLTIDEDYNGNGDPTDDDTDTNGIPDYLESSVALSVEDFNTAGFQLYPNPAKDHVTLQLNHFNETLTLEIIDLQGKLIYSKSIHSNTSELNISALKSGLYFLKISSSTNSSIEKLIVD